MIPDIFAKWQREWGIFFLREVGNGNVKWMVYEVIAISQYRNIAISQYRNKVVHYD